MYYDRGGATAAGDSMEVAYTHVQGPIEIPVTYLNMSLGGLGSLGNFDTCERSTNAPDVRKKFATKGLIDVFLYLYQTMHTQRQAGRFFITLRPHNADLAPEELESYTQVASIYLWFELVDGADQHEDIDRGSQMDVLLADCLDKNMGRLDKENEAAEVSKRKSRRDDVCRAHDMIPTERYSLGKEAHDRSKILTDRLQLARMVGAVTGHNYERDALRYELKDPDCPYGLGQQWAYQNPRDADRLAEGFGAEWVRQTGLIGIASEGPMVKTVKLNTGFTWRVQAADARREHILVNELPDLASVRGVLPAGPNPRQKYYDSTRTDHSRLIGNTKRAVWEHLKSNISHLRDDFDEEEERTRDECSTPEETALFDAEGGARRSKWQKRMLMGPFARALSADDDALIGDSAKGMVTYLKTTPIKPHVVRSPHKNLTVQENLSALLFDAAEAHSILHTHVHYANGIYSARGCFRKGPGRRQHVLFFGPPGTGKSHLMESIVQSFPEHNVVYVSHTSTLSWAVAVANTDETMTQTLEVYDEMSASNVGAQEGGRSGRNEGTTDERATQFKQKATLHKMSFKRNEEKIVDGVKTRGTTSATVYNEQHSMGGTNMEPGQLESSFQRRFVQIIIFILRRMDKTFDDVKVREMDNEAANQSGTRTRTHASSLDAYYQEVLQENTVLHHLYCLAEYVGIVESPSIETFNQASHLFRDEIDRRGLHVNYTESVIENSRYSAIAAMQMDMLFMGFNSAVSPARAGITAEEQESGWGLERIFDGFLEAERHGAMGDRMARLILANPGVQEAVFPKAQEIATLAMRSLIRDAEAADEEDEDEEGAAACPDPNYVKLCTVERKGDRVRTEPVRSRGTPRDRDPESALIYKVAELINQRISQANDLLNITFDANNQFAGGLKDMKTRTMNVAGAGGAKQKLPLIKVVACEEGAARELWVLRAKLVSVDTRDNVVDMLRATEHAFTRAGTQTYLQALTQTTAGGRRENFPQLMACSETPIHSGDCHVRLPLDANAPRAGCACLECAAGKRRTPTTWASVRADARKAGRPDSQVLAAFDDTAALLEANRDDECAAVEAIFVDGAVDGARTAPCTCFRGEIKRTRNKNYLSELDRQTQRSTLPVDRAPPVKEDDPDSIAFEFAINCPPEDVVFENRMRLLRIPLVEPGCDAEARNVDTYSRYHPFYNRATYIAADSTSVNYPLANVAEIRKNVTQTGNRKTDVIAKRKRASGDALSRLATSFGQQQALPGAAPPPPAEALPAPAGETRAPNMSPERGAHPAPLFAPPGSPEQMQAADEEERPCLSADSGRDFRPAQADAHAHAHDGADTMAKHQKC